MSDTYKLLDELSRKILHVENSLQLPIQDKEDITFFLLKNNILNKSYDTFEEFRDSINYFLNYLESETFQEETRKLGDAVENPDVIYLLNKYSQFYNINGEKLLKFLKIKRNIKSIIGLLCFLFLFIYLIVRSHYIPDGQKFTGYDMLISFSGGIIIYTIYEKYLEKHVYQLLLKYFIK